MKHIFLYNDNDDYIPLIKFLNLPSLILILFLVSVFFIFPIIPAYAAVTVNWYQSAGVSPSPIEIESGELTGTFNPLSVHVEDTSLASNGISNTISVTVTSSAGDSINLTLSETTPNSGIFDSGTIIFMKENAKFSVTDTATITVKDTSKINSVSNEVLIGGTSGVTVYSEKDSSGLSINLTEVGDTGIFKRTLHFCTSCTSSSSSATLEVNTGNIITVVDDVDSKASNGIITPTPSNKDAIIAVEGGTVTATYSGTSAIQGINSAPAPGRGGGGLVRPGLVIDSIAAIVARTTGGSSIDSEPPTLGMDSDYNRVVADGFVYNGIPTDVERFYTHYPLITVKVGQENKAVFKIYENGGEQKIKHFDFAFGLKKGQVISHSKAMIEWDRDFLGIQTVNVVDPEHALEHIKVESETGKCSPTSFADCLILTIYHTFRSPLEFNIVGTNVWDEKRNSWQNYFNDGIEVTGKSINAPEQVTALDRIGYIHTLTIFDKNSAIDENGDTWNKINNIWTTEFKTKKIQDKITLHGINRYSTLFPAYIKEQQTLAESVMKKIALKPIANPYFGKNSFPQIDLSSLDKRSSLEFKQKLSDEDSRARQLYDELFPSHITE